MVRRRSTDDSSLELLLDTVCNVFGGVIFMAMLIAVLTSQTSDKVAADAQKKLGAMVDLRRVDVTLARIAELEASLLEIEKTSETIGTGEAKRSQQLSELIGQRTKETQERITAAQRWLARFDELENELADDLDRRLNNAKSDLNQQQAVAGDTRRTKTIQGRLPIERRTSKKQIILIVTQSKAFVVVWPLSPAASRLVTGNQDRDTSVNLTAQAMTVTLNQGGGIAINSAISRHERFTRLLSMFESNDYFFDLFVTADSVAAFGILRDAIAGGGFGYNIQPIPTPDNDQFHFSPADSVSVQ